jgi:hypothetical protein
MPLYRSISRVEIGDGRCTSFWLDAWLPGGALCMQLPGLFSHALDEGISVSAVFSAGVCNTLVPRMNSTGEHQLVTLLHLLHEVTLSLAPDERILTRCKKKNGALDAAALYRLRTWGGVDSPACAFVWHNHAPSKVRFFAWLLSKARIQSRSSLLRKCILTVAEAACPICGGAEETADHITFECRFARGFWHALGFLFPPDARVKELHSYPVPPVIPAATGATFTLMCCWHLWKHRNAVAFREQRPSLPLLLKNCKDDTALWKHRLSLDRQVDADAWLSCLDTARDLALHM